MTLPDIPKAGLVGRKGKPFEPEDALIDTANAAWTLGLPLLLTGEPGCGKTDFAIAVGKWWQKESNHGPPLEAYVRSDTRAP